ncbi:hypothetical protein BG015_010799 [Linnemannia schmuckeri]|uniref:Uncharacterized protein n=1 Tax=Linnemannia schmuckeri TaxID=64567 RepID=A0A9P5RTI9_9FUNG|nr:hypothetical protein BG015_010799 [Linnemannia schmuckeri]
MSDSNQEITMASPSEQQQELPQQWNQPSGTIFAEEGLPLWTAGTINGRSLRSPFVKSFGLRHKATMDWGMRARARTQRHWDKYWHQVETGLGSSDFNNLDKTGISGGSGTGADTRTGKSTCAGAGGSGGSGGDNNKGPAEETMLSSSQDAISYSHGASTSLSFTCTSALDCTQNSNLDTNNHTSSTDESYSTTTKMKDNGLARAETESSFAPDMISLFPGDNDGPGSLFFFQLLNHYQKPSSSQDPSTYFTPTTADNSDDSNSNNTHSTFRQHYQINREFYKPGGPIILWLPGESPLHSLFLRRGLAYELANATAGLLVALEHRFYGNSIPRFQDLPIAHKDGPLIFDADLEKQESSSSSAHSNRLSNSEYPFRYMAASPLPPTETEGEVEQTGPEFVWMAAGSLASSTLPNTGPTKSNHQIEVDKASRARIKERKHRNINGGKQHDPPPPPHDQTDKVNGGNRTNNGNNDSTSDEEKEGLPLDLLRYLNVDQSIEDIARFMDLFPTLQPKLFPPLGGEGGNPVTTAPAPSKPRWILAGCSYGGNLAAWTRQRYPSKVFAAFASSAPVRSALDFFEYSTSQIDILGDKCSTQLGMARDFLDGALQMTDRFMQQMAVVDQLIKQQNTTNSADPIVSTLAGQERGQMVAETSDFDEFAASAATATNPMPIVSDDDKASRQAAKLRVLSWFSPDFAREYAAEGEEFHAAGWIWWTVASAVQYNAVVTPITVQPARTAVDILCDAMDLAKVDDLAGTGSRSLSNSDNGSNGNNSLRSQLKSLRYTQALASWFKDQQYFTQEDLQPSDLDPTSVQNLAGMAWLWQTCSELGYLQTAHPSTCCCTSLARSSPFWSLDTTTKDFIRRGATAIEQNSNATCPLISDTDSTFYSTTLPDPLPGTSASTSTPVTLTSTRTAGSTCLPCRCYADEAQRTESVFSRLLTLEAAWQECQFYFSSTYPPARNSTTRPSSSLSTSSSSTSSSSISSSSKETTVVRNSDSKPAGAVEDVDTFTTATNGLIGRSPGGPPGDIQQCVATNPGATQQQQHKKHDDILLMGYPDVETNVNTKFHGWEIAQDPCYPSGSADQDPGIETGPDNNYNDCNYSRSEKVHFTSSSTITATTSPGTTASSVKDLAADDASAASELETSAEGAVAEQNKEITMVVAQSGSTQIASELDDWLIDRPGGRYYFTNGEKDPWKELTLASSRALEFLSHPKVESGSNSGSAGTGNKKRSKKRVHSKQDSAVQAVPLESAEALGSTLPTSVEVGQEGGSFIGRVAPQDAVEDNGDKDPVAVVVEPPESTTGAITASTLHRDLHNHRKEKQHRHHRLQQQHHSHKGQPKHPARTRSPVGPCQFSPPPSPSPRGQGGIGITLSQPKLSDQGEDIVSENGASGSDGSTVVIVELEVEVKVDESEKKDDEQQEEDERTTFEDHSNNRTGEDEYGDRTVMRIISDASHCQDILYESGDHNSAKLRAEREHVLKTFVRWIEIDNRRLQRALERQQKYVSGEEVVVVDMG